MTRRVLIGIMLVLMGAGAAGADSPLTATDFCEAYVDIAIIRDAQKREELDQELFEALDAPGVPLDVKAAIINALGWKIEGKRNAQIYLQMLSGRLKTKIDSNSVKRLRADQLFCLGYLMAMDDYLNPEKAIPVLTLAHYKNPESFTIAIVLAIARGQKVMDRNWCQVWLLADEVLGNKNLRQDMRDAAKKIIIDYLVLYRDDC